MKKELWKPKHIGKEIARRRFTLWAGKVKKFATLKIGCPLKDPTDKNGPWVCPLVITGLGARKISYAFGEDSLQSLTLGLFHSLQLLRNLAKIEKVKIEWLDPKFPLVYDWWDLDDALKMMEKHSRRLYPARKRNVNNRRLSG